MTKREKRIKKLKLAPTSMKYKEIETIFTTEEYDIERGNGSHKLITHKITWIQMTVPIHHGDTKPYYKDELKDFYIKTQD